MSIWKKVSLFNSETIRLLGLEANFFLRKSATNLHTNLQTFGGARSKKELCKKKPNLMKLPS